MLFIKVLSYKYKCLIKQGTHATNLLCSTFIRATKSSFIDWPKLLICWAFNTWIIVTKHLKLLMLWMEFNTKGMIPFWKWCDVCRNLDWDMLWRGGEQAVHFSYPGVWQLAPLYPFSPFTVLDSVRNQILNTEYWHRIPFSLHLKKSLPFLPFSLGLLSLPWEKMNYIKSAWNVKQKNKETSTALILV